MNRSYEIISIIEENPVYTKINALGEDCTSYILYIVGNNPLTFYEDIGFLIDNTISDEYINAIYSDKNNDAFIAALENVVISMQEENSDKQNIANDLLNYRNYCISHYGDTERSVDLYNFKKFLNNYKSCLTTFKLHGNNNKPYLRFIDKAWKNIPKQ